MTADERALVAELLDAYKSAMTEYDSTRGTWWEREGQHDPLMQRVTGVLSAAPTVGVPFNRTDVEIIVPTYVQEAESPGKDGGCLTAAVAGRPINAAGWYVEFHYPDRTESYRAFIPFPEAVAS